MTGNQHFKAPVRSVVTHRSVLGPLLFLLYIDALDTCLVRKLSKLAGDVKLGANAANPIAVKSLPQDLDRIVE